MSKTSLIPAGMRLEGEIEGAGDLVVAGVVVGPIQLEGGLVIEEGGEVRGDVSVERLIVRGTLAGDSKAKELIRIEPTAAVVGDASAPGVHIIDGARFRGRVRMTGELHVPKGPRRRRRRGTVADRTPEPVPNAPTAVGVDAPLEETLVGAPAPSNEVRFEDAPTGRLAAAPATDGRAPTPPRRERESADGAPDGDPEGDAGPRRRRKRRRKKGGPPPPTIPSVGRQKARRKDRGAADVPPYSG